MDYEQPTPDDLDFRGVTSRYIDIPAVSIGLAGIPERFQHLLDYAKHWAIGDDVERVDLMWLTPHEELKCFVAAVRPCYEAIHAWCREHDGDTPVPDEVVVFDMMLESFRDAAACFTDIEENGEVPRKC